MKQCVLMDIDDFVAVRDGNREEDYDETIAHDSAIEYVEVQLLCDERTKERGGLTSLTCAESLGVIREILFERYEAELSRRRRATGT